MKYWYFLKNWGSFRRVFSGEIVGIYPLRIPNLMRNSLIFGEIRIFEIF